MLDEIKTKIKSCIEKLYRQDEILFTRNKGKGLCERCMVFRFALYLQKKFPEYFVDCDFNSAVENGGNISGKPITNSDGTITPRFVDIIIHRRTFERGSNDFVCFEIKKWNNYDKEASTKDKNNLRGLTSEYDYQFGFYIVLGKTLDKTKWTIFEGGNTIEENMPVFVCGDRFKTARLSKASSLEK